MARKSLSTAGSGVNTLVMDGAANVDLANGREPGLQRTRRLSSTSRTSTASALEAGISITGTVGARTSLPAASGGDTIDGGGGARASINAGAGDDTVYFHGTEVSIDGGSGNNTLRVFDATGGMTAINFSLAPERR